jgi:hypothetical protein
MRQGVDLSQRELLYPSARVKKDQLPLSVQNQRRRVLQVGEAQGVTGTEAQDGTDTPVIMTMQGQPLGDKEGVQTAVQNFRKILMDIEKQQALQREQLEGVVQ